VPVDRDRCQPCIDWEAGFRKSIDEEGAKRLIAAIVERAVGDLGGSPGEDECLHCARPNRECAAEYMEVVRELGQRADGDPVAVMLVLGSIAAACP